MNSKTLAYVVTVLIVACMCISAGVFLIAFRRRDRR